MKIYKTYFKKTDTPTKQDVVWQHKPIISFGVYKIKLFGLFTIYKKGEKINV